MNENRRNWVSSLLILLIIGLLPFGYGGSVVTASTSETPEGFTSIAENARFLLFVDENTGEFQVDDKLLGMRWYSLQPDRRDDLGSKGTSKDALDSLVAYKCLKEDGISTVDLTSYAFAVRAKTTIVEPIENGFEVTYDLVKRKIKTKIQVTIGMDCIRVDVPASGLSDDPAFSIFELSLLPNLCAAGPDQEGYLLTPDGTGSIITMNTGKDWTVDYDETLYGRDRAIDPEQSALHLQRSLLPVFGMKTGENAMLGIVTQGAEIARISAVSSGRNSHFNRIGPVFNVRTVEDVILGKGTDNSIPVRLLERGGFNFTNLQVCYYPLRGGYVEMAAKTAEVLFGERKDASGQEAVPLFLDIHGTIQRTRNILGIPVQVQEPMTSYGQTRKMLESLRDEGVGAVRATLFNWSKESAGSAFSKRSSLFGRLGGESEFHALLDGQESGGYGIFLSTDITRFRTWNPIQRIFEGARRLYNTFVVDTHYRISTFDALTSEEPVFFVKPERLTGLAMQVAAGLKPYDAGIEIGGLANQLYSHYPSTSDKTTVIQTAEVMQQALGILKDSGKPLMGSSPNLYAMRYLDYATDVPVTSSRWLASDYDVPFLQLVLGGHIQYTTPPINLADDPDWMFLKALETGSLLHFSFVWEDPTRLKGTSASDLFSCRFADWEDRAVVMYRKMVETHKAQGFSRIIGHERLAEGVFRSDFASGTSIVVNYGETSVVIDGKRVEPMGFATFD